MKIHILANDVINKIAAGEVVERPLSVVRELVDNAVDAGASEIRISIQGGGMTSVAVSDNGCGMSSSDAVRAFARHATSKLKDASDLQRISTLGFRGEALSAIASVSRIRLCTRQKEDQSALELNLNAGVVGEQSVTARAPGTEIEVQHLFFNTPARKKFLRTPKNEELRIKEWVLHNALNQPQIHIRLSFDGKEVLNLAPKASFLERAQEIFRGTSVPVERSDTIGSVTGLVLHPSQAQSQREVLVLLVNGRLVSDRIIARAVREGFQSTLKDREVPCGVVKLELAPDRVDVNVHPQKSEVRFREPQEVFLLVRRAVKEAVEKFRGPVSTGFSGPTVSSSIGHSTFKEVPFEFSTTLSNPVERSEAAEISFCFSNLKYIGQLFSCYLLCEKEGEFVVVDMHAAHERYNYNLIRNRFKDPQSQELLIPQLVYLNESSLNNMRESQHLLEQLGFRFEIFDDSAKVTSVPAVLANGDISAMVSAIAAHEFLAEIAVQEQLDAIAASAACHASVRSGDYLSPQEVESLFEALDRSEFSAACPHGRPVVVSFSEAQVERWFGRDR